MRAENSHIRFPRRRDAALLLVGLAMAGASADAGAQVVPPSTPGPACAGAQHRAFDFWIGSWVVRDTAGAEVGRNEIRRVSDGCALLESWTDARGRTGTSLNWFGASDGKWRQLWVGGGGQVLRLEGEPVEGAMQLRGRRTGPNGAEIVDRIRWMALPDGRVRQHWETSTDGVAWQTVFDGYYARRTPGGDSVP